MACVKVEGQAEAEPEPARIEIPVKPFIARMVDTGNLIVEIRPDKAIPAGYARVGPRPSVDVDHASATITVAGLYTFEPSADPTLEVPPADRFQSFEFDPPEPKKYQIIYHPEHARGTLAKRAVDFGPPKQAAKNEFLSISPTATVTRDSESKTMTVALSLSGCVGGLKTPVGDDLMVGINLIERKILVFGAYRFNAPTGDVPKYCRVNPETPKRVFQFENTEPGQYEILYERRRFPGKPMSWPRMVTGRQLDQVDLS
ncbi:MAG: hypothetical protein NXH78_01925 [Hyphomonadaceae bacterium]|nr:hypothetical protein [Hyphomonadaceae bacterium]